MALELDNVQVRYHGTSVFEAVTLTICRGEIATVMGPSGCGKSTLLAAIAGNLQAGFTVAGRVVLNGRELQKLRMEKRRVGLLFQDHLLFPHLDVFGNLAFGLRPELTAQEKRETIIAALSKAGLEAFADRDVATLSGGQKARISLLRTLLAAPEAVLLDEPFSQLDKPMRASFRSFVHQQIRLLDIPALLVTHDEEDSCGGHIVKLHGQEGG